ncbi:hypothetical protein [Streptomyces sp. NPDC001843]|uniref:hypothetical protein n=1 Tax=Streptomyces sp. NPDC001843 TaxID=3364617 RepID=UPI0036820CBB
MRLPRDPSNVTDVLVAAFPNHLAGDVHGVLVVMPDATHAPVESFEVEVQGETVAIPSRIYNDEPSADSERLLTGTQQVILHCLYSRHSDGRVRHRHLEQILASTQPWVAPFVVQLAGEYVLEILDVIGQGLADLAAPGSAQRRLYGEFITRNPVFFARTERRVVSYWSCYHRWKHPVFGAYPGGALMEAFRAAASEHLGARWPRNTPRP